MQGKGSRISLVIKIRPKITQNSLKKFRTEKELITYGDIEVSDIRVTTMIRF